MRGERIIVADDHPVFREGLRLIVQKTAPQAEVVESSDFDEMVRLAREGQAPTTFIIDLIFGGHSMEARLPALRREFPQASIIFISMMENRAVATRIMEQGADGYIGKSLPPGEISAAIAAVRNGEQVLLLDSGPASPSLPRHPIGTLTPRQLTVLRLLAAGMSNKEIAQELEISPFTVRIHVSALLKALGVTTRAAAASVAVARGMA